MKYQDFKKWNAEDAGKHLKEAQARLQELRFKLGANQVKNVREVRELRLQIAQLKTYLLTLSESK